MCIPQKHTKIQEEIADGDELQKEGPPPMESKGTKAKKTALSLFDDDDDEDMNTDEIIPAPKIPKSTEKNALKVSCFRFLVLWGMNLSRLINVIYWFCLWS